MSNLVSANGAPHPGPTAFDPHDDSDANYGNRTSFDFRHIVSAIQSNLWLIALIVAAALGIGSAQHA